MIFRVATKAQIETALNYKLVRSISGRNFKLEGGTALQVTGKAFPEKVQGTSFTQRKGRSNRGRNKEVMTKVLALIVPA